MPSSILDYCSNPIVVANDYWDRTGYLPNPRWLNLKEPAANPGLVRRLIDERPTDKYELYSIVNNWPKGYAYRPPEEEEKQIPEDDGDEPVPRKCPIHDVILHDEAEV